MSSWGSGTENGTILTGDFALLRLNQIPQQTQQNLVGWDRTLSQTSNSVFGIHHPQGDFQKISQGNLQPNDPNLPFMHLVKWSANQGITENGSSGSPLFNGNRLMIGHLSGGFSTCFNPTLTDYYARFAAAWDGPPSGSNQLNRLSDWLAPVASNQPISIGMGFANASQFTAPSVNAINCSETITISNPFPSPNTFVSWAAEPVPGFGGQVSPASGDGTSATLNVVAPGRIRIRYSVRSSCATQPTIVQVLTNDIVLTRNNCPVPPQPCNLLVVASSNSPVTAGGPLNLNANISGAATTGAITYTWSGPNGYNSSEQNPTISNVATNQAGTYSVAVSQGNCTNNSSTNVTVNPTPPPGCNVNTDIQINTDGQRDPALGGTPGFVIVAQNVGNQTANGITARVQLPANGVAFSSFDAAGSSPGTSMVYDATTRIITATFNQINPGGLLIARYNLVVTAAGRYINKVCLNCTDTNAGNNTAQIDFWTPGFNGAANPVEFPLACDGGSSTPPVTPPPSGCTGSADIALSTDGQRDPNLGATAGYAVVATNNGPDVATNVIARMKLPAGVEYAGFDAGGSYAGTSASYNASTRTITLTFSNPITPNNYAVARYFLQINGAGRYMNRVYLTSSDRCDANAGNNMGQIDFWTPGNNNNPTITYFPNPNEGGRLATVTEESENVLKVSPNPTNGRMVVRFQLSSGQAAQLITTTASGVEINRRAVVGTGQDQEEVISLEREAPGIYLINLQTDGKRLTGKVILQK